MKVPAWLKPTLHDIAIALLKAAVEEGKQIVVTKLGAVVHPGGPVVVLHEEPKR